ncbi:MAG: hypothetical protein ACR2FM_02205 [Candidatus Saccharimonadales bacterium]
MSSVPGEMPSFDFNFGPQRTYDHIQLADTVVWPLVNEIWWQDWRTKSHLGNEMHVLKRGVINSQLFDVAIGAYTELTDREEEPGDSNPIISVATIDIRSIVEDERKDMILSLAAYQSDELEHYDVEHLLVNTGTVYKFGTDNDVEIETSQSVESIDGQIVWYSDSTDEDEEADEPDEDTPTIVIYSAQPATKIFDQDMDMLQAGLLVFNSPTAIIKALHTIRDNPVLSQKL